jgi:hypothetical protein
MCYALYVCTQIIRGEICRHTRPPSCPDGPTARGTQLHNHSNLSCDRTLVVQKPPAFHHSPITDTQTPHTLTGYGRCGGQVITPLVTSTSTGMNNTVEGKQFDEEGDGFLVGVAIVQPTGDPLIDLILSLRKNNSSHSFAASQMRSPRCRCIYQSVAWAGGKSDSRFARPRTRRTRRGVATAAEAARCTRGADVGPSARNSVQRWTRSLLVRASRRQHRQPRSPN